MTKERFLNELVEEMMTAEAWTYLSENFKWTEALLEKCADKIDWEKLSGNGEMVWTQPILDKFKSKLCWNTLSENYNSDIFSDANLERYKNYWNWSILSENRRVEFTIETIEKFEDKWDWAKLIDAIDLSGELSIEILKRFISNIPVDKLMQSFLWNRSVWAKYDEITREIVL